MPSIAIDIRRATQEDLERIVAIENLCFRDNFWDFHAFLNYDCTVAEIHKTIVGFIASRQLVSNINNDGEREILNLAVHPGFRRCGIAKALINEELAKGGRFFLEVRESNEAARKLYESFGFYNVGKRQGYYTNPSESAIVMKSKE